MGQHILPAACCLLRLEQQLSERDVEMCSSPIIQLTDFKLQGPTAIEMYRLHIGSLMETANY